MTGRLRRILNELISEGELCAKENLRPYIGMEAKLFLLAR